MRKKPSIASSIMSAAASREAGSRRLSIALARRACACSWRPSRCSTPAQAGREPHPQRDRVGRHERDALQQGGVAVGELAGRDQRPGPGEEELDTRIGRRGIGQEPQRVSKPGRGARGRALCHGVAGLAQSRDGGRVPLPRGTLDMMRALHGGCTAGGERLGAPIVRAQSPAAAASTGRPPAG